MVIHEQMHMLCILPLMQTPYYIKNKTFFTAKLCPCSRYPNLHGLVQVLRKEKVTTVIRFIYLSQLYLL